MAVRSATRRYADIPAFLADHKATLRVGAVYLPPGTIEGDPAPFMKVDLVVPLIGRIGPIDGQLVQLMGDGGVALRVAEMPAAVEQAVTTAKAVVTSVKEWLLSSGELALPATALEQELTKLRARVAELEARRPETVYVQVGGEGGPAVVAAPAVPGARGLPLPDMRGLRPEYSGSLGQVDFRDALMAMAVHKMTGVLELRLPDGAVKYGFWSKGGTVGWRTEPVDEQEVLGVLLFRGGQITKEQLAESLERMQRDNCRQGEALIEMGVFGFAQLVMMLQKQTEFVLQRVMAMREGSFTFTAVPELPERFVNPPLRVAALLYKQLKSGAKSMAAEDLSNALRPMLDQYVFVRPGAERVLEEMRLTAEEQQFVRILNGTSYRLRESFSVSNLSRSITAYTVWCFSQLGLLEFRGEAAQERGDVALAKKIDARKATADLNHFARLDLHWICTSAEVEAAWARLSVEFSVDRIPEYGERHRPAIEKISRAMREAYDVLRDEHKRREYRAGMIEAPMLQQSAFMLAEKGDMAVMKDSAREALECFSKAAELIPNNGRFAEGLARARQMR